MGYNQINNPFSRKTSPLNEGGYCAKSAGKGGCVTQKDGSWKVISNKTGKLWDANYSSKADAEAALRAYHAGGPSRVSSSPLNEYSRELADMPIVDIEKGDAEGDKYKKVINEAMMQKATKAEVSAKLREMFPEVKNNSVEVNWSPDGQKVEVYKKGISRKASPLNDQNKGYGSELGDMPVVDIEKGDAEGDYTNPLNAHMVNSWEEEDVKRGRKLKKEGHYSHAEALFDDAHGSYNWDGHNSTGAEHHGPSRRSKEERRANRADKLREKAITRSEETGAERGDEYDYEDPKVMKWLNRANKIDPRTGENVK